MDMHCSRLSECLQLPREWGLWAAESFQCTAEYSHQAKEYLIMLVSTSAQQLGMGAGPELTQRRTEHTAVVKDPGSSTSFGCPPGRMTSQTTQQLF